MSSTSFWSNQRVCVTGGSGFLGSHVIEKLCQRGCRDQVKSEITKSRNTNQE
jgi:nucleoside-diphosphate-sugar epimerase